MFKKNRILTKNCLAFSMIEIIVALSILSVAFVSLAGIFPFGISISKDAENTTEASYLCQQKIEQIISLGYDNIPIGTTEVKSRLSATSTDYLYNFQRQTVVSYVNGSLASSATDVGIKKISTTVYFNDSIDKSKEESYNITTLLSRR